MYDKSSGAFAVTCLLGLIDLCGNW